jgi:hypothetical protein
VFIKPLFKNSTFVHNPAPDFCPWYIQPVKSSTADTQKYSGLPAAQNVRRTKVCFHASLQIVEYVKKYALPTKLEIGEMCNF